MRTKKIRRLRRRMDTTVKITCSSRQFYLRIPVKLARNLKIEKGDKFRFITDRKRRFQSFEIIKK